VAEEKRMTGELEENRERMLADADFRISQESKQARDELSREALESALDAAEKLLETSVTPADHERLCEQYLEEVAAALRLKPVAGPGGAR
jgi:F0F1-type ATP synthase membrane subunit b/b'